MNLKVKFGTKKVNINRQKDRFFVACVWYKRTEYTRGSLVETRAENAWVPDE